MSLHAIVTGMPAKGTTIARRMSALTQGLTAKAIMSPVCFGTAFAATNSHSLGLMIGSAALGAICIRICSDYMEELAKLAPEYKSIEYRAEQIHKFKKMG